MPRAAATGTADLEVGGADGTDQRENFIFVDQRRSVRDRGFWFVGIVPESQLQSAPVYSAVLVDFLESGEDAGPHTESEF